MTSFQDSEDSRCESLLLYPPITSGIPKDQGGRVVLLTFSFQKIDDEDLVLKIRTFKEQFDLEKTCNDIVRH